LLHSFGYLKRAGPVRSSPWLGQSAASKAEATGAVWTWAVVAGRVTSVVLMGNAMADVGVWKLRHAAATGAAAVASAFLVLVNKHDLGRPARPRSFLSLSTSMARRRRSCCSLSSRFSYTSSRGVCRGVVCATVAPSTYAAGEGVLAEETVNRQRPGAGMEA